MTVKRAVCLLCEQEKQIYARGGCYGCYRSAQSCGMLDEWFPDGKAAPANIEARAQRNLIERERMSAGRAAFSLDTRAAHIITYREDAETVQAECPCGYASLRFTGYERPQTAGAAHLLAMTFLGGRDA